MEKKPIMGRLEEQDSPQKMTLENTWPLLAGQSWDKPKLNETENWGWILNAKKLGLFP